MKTTKDGLLISSLVLNALLIGGLFWFAVQTRQQILEYTAQAADQSANVQQRVIDDLATKDPIKISVLTNDLHWNIEAQRRVVYKVRTHDGF